MSVQIGSSISDGSAIFKVKRFAHEDVGDIKISACSTTPTGWLLCDGSAISRTLYSDLFSAIGTTYGSGNGSTTFNLPNLIDKTIWGGGHAAA